MCCTPTERLLIVLTFCHPTYCCPLNRLPAPRLLHPRSGLERSDFVPWHQTDMPNVPANVRSRGTNGPAKNSAWSAPLEPDRLKLVI